MIWWKREDAVLPDTYILHLPVDRPASIAMNWRWEENEGTTEEVLGKAHLDDIGNDWKDVRGIAGNRDQWRNLFAQCSDRSRRN